MIKSNSLPFPIGTYGEDGQATISTTDVLGPNWEGQTYVVPDINPQTKSLRTTQPRKVRVVRNNSGTTLYKSRLVVLDTSAGTFGTRANGYAHLDAQRCRPVDEWLDSRGVPANALFYIVEEGPAEILNGTAADATNVIVAGDGLVSLAASTSGNSLAGRVTPISINNGTTANSTNAAMIRNRIGVAMSASTTSNTGVAILVNLHPFQY